MKDKYKPIAKANSNDPRFTDFECPKCKRMLGILYKYCPECGVKIDWSEEKP